jgi:hypothetical protein
MEADMGVLGKLKIIVQAPKAKASAEQDRRTKLIEQLDEQKKMAEGILAALVGGPSGSGLIAVRAREPHVGAGVIWRPVR